MKNTKTLLSAALVTAIILPMAISSVSANFWDRNSNKWDFQKMTVEERVEKINSNENLTDERKAEIIKKITARMAEREERRAKMTSLLKTAPDEIKAIYEKKVAWEEISDNEKALVRAFMEKNWIERKSGMWKRMWGKMWGKHWNGNWKRMWKWNWEWHWHWHHHYHWKKWEWKRNGWNK